MPTQPSSDDTMKKAVASGSTSRRTSPAVLPRSSAAATTPTHSWKIPFRRRRKLSSTGLISCIRLLSGQPSVTTSGSSSAALAANSACSAASGWWVSTSGSNIISARRGRITSSTTARPSAFLSAKWWYNAPLVSPVSARICASDAAWKPLRWISANAASSSVCRVRSGALVEAFIRQSYIPVGMCQGKKTPSAQFALQSGAQKFVAQLIAVTEAAGESLGDHALVAAPVLAQKQAQLLGLDDACGALRHAVRHQRLGDVARHPFLVGEAVPDGVDHARDAPETVQPPAGDVGDVRHAAERHQMVRAHAVDGDSAHHHHVVAVVGEALAQRVGGRNRVAAEQPALPQFAHALGGAPGVHRVRRDAAGGEEVVYRALERRRIEWPGLRDAEAARAGWRVAVVVVAGVGHQSSVALRNSSVRVHESTSAAWSYLSGRPNCAA